MVCDLCSSGGARKPNGLNDINRIETFNHADKKATEAYIVELLLWLNLLTNQLTIDANVAKKLSIDSQNDVIKKPSQEGQDLKQNDTRDDENIEGSEESTNDLQVLRFDSEHKIEKASVSVDDVLV